MFGKDLVEIFSAGLTHTLKGVSLRPPSCQKLVGVGLVRIELTLLAEHRLSYTSSVMTLLDCQLHCLS